MVDNSPSYDYCIDSTHLYEVYCIDRTGYSETYTCPGLCRDGRCLDMTPPTIYITSPADGSTIIDKYITLLTQASGNTLSVDFYIDNIFQATDSVAPFTYKFASRTYLGRNIAIKAVGKADNGFSAEDTVRINVGSQPKPQCNDAVDNDNDQTCDYAGCKIKGRQLQKDAQCTSADDNSEAS